ncbi:MAG: hypothetical protein GX672_04060 [Synergistaceae bacterium]|nr:hypothetical protein [Synergistaceae bacterium]
MCEEIRSAEDDVVSEWKEIVSNDDDVASGELLSWSGLSDIWDRHELWGEFDFLRDVAEFCSHIDIGREEWDANFPGHSGTWHIIETDDEDELKKEMRKRLASLIRTNRRKIKLFIKKQEEQEKQKLEKLRKGPKRSVYIGTAWIWDDVSPTKYEYYFETPFDDKHPRLIIWEKANDRWSKSYELNHGYSGDMKEEGIQFMRQFNKGTDDVLEVILGALLKEEC